MEKLGRKRWKSPSKHGEKEENDEKKIMEICQKSVKKGAKSLKKRGEMK